MQITDPIADLLTRIRNASRTDWKVGPQRVTAP